MSSALRMLSETRGSRHLQLPSNRVFLPPVPLLPDVNGHPAYFDNMATTPLDPRVQESMMPFLTDHFGNPHSRSHVWGTSAAEACETAREQLASLIGANPRDVIFTSGATESDNLAIKGAARYMRANKGRTHVITTIFEHKASLEACRSLESEGFTVTYLPVSPQGIVDLDALRADLDAHKGGVALVSIMAVNNEVGTIQPLEAIGQLCAEHGTLFHSDAAQAVGKIPIDVLRQNINLLSMTAHKIYGPKGVGALYVSRRPRARVEPLFSGGGQERGMRPGTLAPAQVIGFGAAAAIAQAEMALDWEHEVALATAFRSKVDAGLEEVVLNGDERQRVPGCVNLSFAHVEGESLLLALEKDCAVSSGSACTSESLEPSYVLHALGLEAELAHTSIRFGFGRFNRLEEVEDVADRVVTEVSRLRELSPLWEMFKAGIDLSSIKWTEH